MSSKENGNGHNLQSLFGDAARDIATLITALVTGLTNILGTDTSSGQNAWRLITEVFSDSIYAGHPHIHDLVSKEEFQTMCGGLAASVMQQLLILKLLGPEAATKIVENKLAELETKEAGHATH